MEASNRRLLPGLVHSFSVKLLLLALILLSVPLILYWQFGRAEQEQERLLSKAVDQTNRVTAVLLTPRFERFSVEPPSLLQSAMTRAAGGHTHIKVLMRLAGSPPDGFIYVASTPVFPCGVAGCSRPASGALPTSRSPRSPASPSLAISTRQTVGSPGT